MTEWLYQIAGDDKEEWYPEDYRVEVWEGKTITWEARRVVYRDGPAPRPGDRVVFFFCKSYVEEPGLYGWGVVLDYQRRPNNNRLRFRLAPPSDFLKMSPCWDASVERTVNRIRNHTYTGTLWPILPDDFRRLCNKIHDYSRHGPGRVGR